MPQLDFYSVGNQYFVGLVVFSAFYFLVNRYVIPVTFTSLVARRTFLTRNAFDYQYRFYYIFFSFYVFSQLTTNFSNIFFQAIQDKKLFLNNFTWLFEDCIFIELNTINSDVYDLDFFENQTLCQLKIS